MRTRRAAPVLFVLLGACAVSYEPERIEFEGAADQATFLCCVDVLRAQYPNLQVEAAEFRAWSDWNKVDDLGLPGKRRVALFLDQPGVIGLVVEVSYLALDWLGNPNWTTPEGHRRWERELAADIRQALAARGSGSAF